MRNLTQLYHIIHINQKNYHCLRDCLHFSRLIMRVHWARLLWNSESSMVSPVQVSLDPISHHGRIHLSREHQFILLTQNQVRIKAFLRWQPLHPPECVEILCDGWPIQGIELWRIVDGKTHQLELLYPDSREREFEGTRVSGVVNTADFPGTRQPPDDQRDKRRDLG